MNTTIFKIDRENIDNEIIKKASDIIRGGDLVAFPTETVYGLGADGLSSSACEKIFIAKGRPSDNPLILHISDIEMLYNLVDKVSEPAEHLIKNCWPGPLTLIFNKKDIVPDIVSAGLSTVAIRMPSDEIARSLIEYSNTPIAAPSANRSGKPSPTKASHVYEDMNGKIPMILDGGNSDIGIESTVVDMSTDSPTILRPGYFTYEYLKNLIPNIRLDEGLVDESITPKSPGQKYTHYSPTAKMEVYVGDGAIDEIYKKAKSYKGANLKVGILVFEKDLYKFNEFLTISLGNKDDLSDMSHVLFASLRQMDEHGIDIILAEGVRDIGLGKSIMNRMSKSASGNVNYL